MANREICKYCRNLVLFGEEIPDEQAEEHAIMMCDCTGARIHQRAAWRGRERCQFLQVQQLRL